jgi:FkbM family methyltransferase
MRIHELVSSRLDGLREVVDFLAEDVDLPRQLRLPATVTHRRPEAVDATELGPATLAVALIGPDPAKHMDSDALSGLLRQLELGAGALLLLGWPVEQLPYHRLLGPLSDGACQVIEAAPLEPTQPGGVTCALFVQRVDRLAPLRAYLGQSVSNQDDDLHANLRVANEYVLADLVARPLRRRVTELDEILAERDRMLGERDRQLAERDAQLHELTARLAKSEARRATLEGSATYQIGRVVVQGIRHPARAVVTMPRDLARVWRSRHVTPVPASERIVSIHLPPAAGGARRSLTLTAPASMHVPKRLAQQGLAGYERESLACFLAAIDVAGSGAVLDIGANVGIYAAVASALSRRDVRAFEPSPSLVDVARRFAADNRLDYKTEPLALGAENGSATFYLSDISDTSNSLAVGFRDSSAQIEVAVETLDSYVARTGVVPAVMKVDTETTEPDVLAGAAKTIVEHRPWILCEVLAGRVEAALMDVLMPFGYHWYHVTEELPYRETTQIAGDRTYTNLMWLFTPRPPGDDFWAAVRERATALATCLPD